MSVADSDERVGALDGLRAVAVMGVFLFHLGVPGCSLGWAGVNLFFVLSGYLITGILRRSRGAQGYLRTFYARRALRIFPIYYLTLTAVLVFAIVTGRPIDDFPYFATYTQNHLLGARAFSPRFPDLLNHTWTLAVEEQFYLLWPFLVGKLATRSLVRVLLAFLLLGPATRTAALVFEWGPYNYFTPLPAQIDALAVGALLSVARERTSERAPTLPLDAGFLVATGAVVCAVAIGLSGIDSYWSPARWTRRPESVFLFVGLALLFGGAIQSASGPKTWFGRMLEARPLRHLGRISYGLYMYHWPIFVLVDHFAATRLPRPTPAFVRLGLDVVKVCLTYGVSYASWRLLENPILRLKDRVAPVPPGPSAL